MTNTGTPTRRAGLHGPSRANFTTARIDESLVGSVVRLPADDRTWGPRVLVIGVSDSGGGAVRISFVRDGVAFDTVLGAEVSAHGALIQPVPGRSGDGHD